MEMLWAAALAIFTPAFRAAFTTRPRAVVTITRFIGFAAHGTVVFTVIVVTVVVVAVIRRTAVIKITITAIIVGVLTITRSAQRVPVAIVLSDILAATVVADKVLGRKAGNAAAHTRAVAARVARRHITLVVIVGVAVTYVNARHFCTWRRRR